MKILIKLTIISIIIILGGLSLTGCSTSSSQPSQTDIQKAIQDEFVGFNKIEIDVNKGDFNSAGQVYEEIHTEFHAMILDQIKSKLGSEYGDNIHGKVGILAESLMSQDTNKIEQAIQLNRNSLRTVAKDMGIKLNK